VVREGAPERGRAGRSEPGRVQAAARWSSQGGRRAAPSTLSTLRTNANRQRSSLTQTPGRLGLPPIVVKPASCEHVATIKESLQRGGRVAVGSSSRALHRLVPPHPTPRSTRRRALAPPHQSLSDTSSLLSASQSTAPTSRRPARRRQSTPAQTTLGTATAMAPPTPGRIRGPRPQVNNNIGEAGRCAPCPPSPSSRSPLVPHRRTARPDSHAHSGHPR